MNDHDAFLWAIFKQPDDPTVRLVYADWLDEHEHPGGALIRVRHQLSLLNSAVTEQATLLTQERNLVEACDQDWLERLEHADWKLRYLKMQKKAWGLSSWLRPRERYWRTPTQNAITRTLAAVEKEIGKPLPRSWKAFAHGCGPGNLGDWFWLAVPTKKEIAVRQRPLFQVVPETKILLPHQLWHRNCIAFGRTADSGYLVWNTATITDPIRNEYEIIETTRELERYRTFKSFEAFWGAALTPIEPGETFDTPFEPS